MSRCNHCRWTRAEARQSHVVSVVSVARMKRQRNPGSNDRLAKLALQLHLIGGLRMFPLPRGVLYLAIAVLAIATAVLSYQLYQDRKQATASRSISARRVCRSRRGRRRSVDKCAQRPRLRSHGNTQRLGRRRSWACCACPPYDLADASSEIQIQRFQAR